MSWFIFYLIYLLRSLELFLFLFQSYTKTIVKLKLNQTNSNFSKLKTQKLHLLVAQFSSFFENYLTSVVRKYNNRFAIYEGSSG